MHLGQVDQVMHSLVDCHEDAHGQYNVQNQEQVVFPSAENVY
jgi:hypothetical protein